MSNVLDAAFHLVRAYPGGASSLAPRIGKNATTLSHEVKGTGSAKFGLDDAVNASLMSNDLRILNAFAAECECMVLRLPVVGADGDETTMRDVASLAREFGELLTVVTAADADGAITANEWDRVQREWAELVAAGQVLLGHLKAKHERAIPLPLVGGGVR